MLTANELIKFEDDIASEFEQGHIHAPVHLSFGNEEKLITIFESYIKRSDWIFSTWRSHYHALLHGIPARDLKEEILNGNSITLCFPEYRFYTSAIVGGIIPIAVGVAMGIKRENDEKIEHSKTLPPYMNIKAEDEDEVRSLINEFGEHVWCFIGDMALETGIFFESFKYAMFHHLPITFVIEDNNLSTSTPSRETWGKKENDSLMIRVLDQVFDEANRDWDLDEREHPPSPYIYYSYKRSKFPHQGIGRFVNF